MKKKWGDQVTTAAQLWSVLLFVVVVTEKKELQIVFRWLDMKTDSSY